MVFSKLPLRFAFLLATLTAISASFVGCGSDPVETDPNTNKPGDASPDTTVDGSREASVLPDTGVVDTGIDSAVATFTIKGNVTGLKGTGLVLQNNAGDNVSVSAGDAGAVSFTFPKKIANGADFAVTVLTQPTSPSQTCTVTGGAGKVAGADVTNVAVNCVTNTYTIGGSVLGLAGSGLVLRNNGGDDKAVSLGDAGSTVPFTFATKLESGASFDVTAFTQPSNPAQNCVVSGGTGKVGAANVTSVVVNCATNTYTVGGKVSGLLGKGLVLQNNAANNLDVSADGSFAFGAAFPSGQGYSVSVLTQPTNPSQTCVVSSGTGSITNANIDTVDVTCTTNSYKVGGKVSGLLATGLVLQNNLGDDIKISTDGAFVFNTAILSGGTYSVTVFSQPSGAPPQTCKITGESGVVTDAEISSVDVVCTTNKYAIGGNVSGLTGTGLVLQNNLGDDLSVSTSGNFTFATPITSGNNYSVTVLTQPTGQFCTVLADNGTVGATDVSSVVVKCAADICPVTPGGKLAWQIDLPQNADWDNAGQIVYATDNRASLGSATWSRIAYCLTLNANYGYAEMNDFTGKNLAQIGVPVDSVYDIAVGSLTVRSNVAGVSNVNNVGTGVIEFWSDCYGTGLNGVYDYDDDRTSTDCYGSFQVHNGTKTVLAWNSWSNPGSGADDVGIGSAPSGHPDWTFAYNTGSFATRRLTAYLIP